MKKISVNQIISVTRKQPFTANSLKFLQDALDEDKAGIIKAFITQSIGSYSLTTPYVISGCVVSDAGKDVTAGEIFYGGKYYETTAVNGTTNVARFILTKTQDAVADPLQFTNGDILNVHDIYKYVATDVASGGDFTSADLVSAYSSGKIYNNVYNATNVVVSLSTYVDITSMTYTTPNDGITRLYNVTYKGTVIPDNGVNDASASVIILAGATTVDEIYVGKISSSSSLESMQLPTILNSGVISVAPNTVIKVQAKRINAGAATLGFTFNRLSVTEF